MVSEVCARCRHAAGGFDLARDQLAEILEVHVAGNELREGIGDRDDRLAEIPVAHAGGAPEAARARHVAAVRRSAGTIGGHRKPLSGFLAGACAAMGHCRIFRRPSARASSRGVRFKAMQGRFGLH